MMAYSSYRGLKDKWQWGGMGIFKICSVLESLFCFKTVSIHKCKQTYFIQVKWLVLSGEPDNDAIFLH